MNFALIGCGRIASRHAQSIKALGANLVAVADVITGRTQQYCSNYGAAAYVDYRALLDRKDIDVVNICTPSGMHAQMALEALQAGKHVILEKPMALDLNDADRIIAAYQSANKKLCVVLQNRYNPPMQDLRKVVDDGLLGRLFLGNATVRWYRTQDYYEDGWHGTWAMDGGALMNQSIHHIDALQWFMGKPRSVFAYTATLAHKMEAEDTGVVAIKFENGGLGTIEGSTITYPENMEGSLALFGEFGSAKIGGNALNRKVIWKIKGKLDQEREILRREGVDPPTVYGYSHQLVIADMIEAIQQDRQPAINPAEARSSLALVLSIYESAGSGMEITL
jgi:UDP-N-acetyl-2-amino-2-deoxyglucuronate dehydrogenase